MTDSTASGLQPMSDRRFITVLISALAAVVGAGLILIAFLGLQDPVYTDFDTGRTTDTSRVLAALIALGAVLILAGATTITTLIRAQLRR